MSLSFPSTNSPSISSPSNSSSSSPLNSCSSDKSMEQVWQNINNFPCLDDNSSKNPKTFTSLSPFTPTIFQDFLASPARNPSAAAAEISPAGTRLSLYSGSSFHRFSRGGESLSAAGFPSSGGGRVNSLAVSVFKKRQQHDGDDDSGDRRHKRMIKNRESAARSRARKQAYAQELEMEVAQLREENARLREKLLADQAQVTRKKEFQRSSSAPF